MRPREAPREKRRSNKRRAPNLRARTDLGVEGWCIWRGKGSDGMAGMALYYTDEGSVMLEALGA